MIDQMASQAVLTAVSWLGIPLGWVAARRPRRRHITLILWGITTNLGAVITVVPWILMPLLAQPRFVGSLRTGAFAMGILLLVAAALITIWATPFIFPAAKKGGDQLDPEFLVVKGPYQWVRHPQYVAAVVGIIGWMLLQGSLDSLLLSPVCYLLFPFEAYLEENRVLKPKFGDQFGQFRRKVPVAFFGRIGTAILLLVYLTFVFLVMLGKVPAE